MVEVVVTDELAAWYQDLDETDGDAVFRLVEQLRERGVALGSPLSSDIKGSRYAFRELRVQSKGRPLRVFYAFDPKRQAVLLIGGDKKGVTDKAFYRDLLPTAEKLWEEYLRETEAKTS